MSKIKVIFVDFDWTLYDHENKVYDMESIEALKECQKRGIKVIISTARNYTSLKNFGALNYLNPDGIISANGNLAKYGDELVYAYEYNHDALRALCKCANKHHLNVELNTKDGIFITSKWMHAYKKMSYYFYDITPKYEKYIDQSVVSILLMSDPKYDPIMQEELKDYNFDFFRFFDYAVDLTLDEPKKGKSVVKMLEYLNISKDEAMSIGDSFSDATMFEVTGVGVCMGNSIEDSVKEKATFVTSHIKDHGVKVAIEKFCL